MWILILKIIEEKPFWYLGQMKCVENVVSTNFVFSFSEYWRTFRWKYQEIQASFFTQLLQLFEIFKQNMFSKHQTLLKPYRKLLMQNSENYRNPKLLKLKFSGQWTSKRIHLYPKNKNQLSITGSNTIITFGLKWLEIYSKLWVGVRRKRIVLKDWSIVIRAKYFIVLFWLGEEEKWMDLFVIEILDDFLSGSRLIV